MTTTQLIASAAAAGGTGIALLDTLVGALKITGRAKNILHLVAIGVVGALKAIRDEQAGGQS